MEKINIAIIVGVAIVILMALLGLTGKLTGIVNISEITSGECNFPSYICQLGTAIGIPSAWLTTDRFIWYALLPIVGIWLIIYGFLSELRIFSDTRINAVLSLVIAFSTIPMGLFVIIVAVMFGLMGMYATLMFVGLFIIGVYYLSGAKIRGWKREFGIYDIEIGRKNSEIKNLQEQLKDVEKRLENVEKLRNERKISKEEALRLTGELTRKRELLRQRIEGIKKEIESMKVEKKHAKKELEYI